MRFVSSALVIALGLSVTACGSTTANRSVNSERQPVVTRSNFVLDLNVSGGALSSSEQDRLIGWFDALDLGYGDRVAIEDPSYASSAAARSTVEAIASRHGLLVSDLAPVTEGYIPSGAMRVVVSRATASVPGCPDWSHRSHTDFQGRTSANYGCGTNSTMAAMMADPNDLVRGQSADGEDQEKASKAIRAYRDKNVGGQ
ncbi:CpaD family pilus assembly protein [Parasphingorhabdus halotolerans]|uniref:Pilus assembly protein CpaD n=1 Tax=Parasphingorhabdus halotolerans TaxID=2725558 RepID=A0A6H2DK57_9SPHN|nr:CpaD family pilus assembly protein [Parasphingorhabdus halotolerans]QJB69059.1 pilus assembly protein CpaD [Parasphingorhabdus halotolerans]